MSSTRGIKRLHTVPNVPSIPLQAASAELWDAKYRLKTLAGEVCDRTLEDTYTRVATALAEPERPSERERWIERFQWALRSGAIPAGRILSNAGARTFKPAVSTINCTVSGTIGDSMADILDRLREAGLTLKAGSGIGYEFSTLRPRGAHVAGAGARTSGPLSFMEIFDRMGLTISSAGDRRGAQMATFDVGHPDILEFIEAKREAGRLRQFNLSVLIDEAFMQAVAEDGEWPLAFPLTASEVQSGSIDLDDAERVVWRPWPGAGDYVEGPDGKVACRIHERVAARRLWDAIVASNYAFAEPGVVLIDRVNHMNNLWWCENIRATNPCGEQPLPPYGACLLGSVNLTRFVGRPFSEKSCFDWTAFREVVGVFTRMLDNVVAFHGLPLPAQARDLEAKRRHGMGYLGLGSALTMLGLRYGSPPALDFTDRVTRELALAGWRAGLDLAREKGSAPILDREFEVTGAMLAARPGMRDDGFSPGDRVAGKVLMARHSHYMQRLAEVDPDLVDALAREGCRFTHHTSIAPTGTIALSLGNNASNGIEPSFAHHYTRNVLQAGRKAKQAVEVWSCELLVYRSEVNPDAHPDAEKDGNRLPDTFVAADDIPPRAHIDMMAAAQKWVDSSISKTINVPTECPYREFQDIYRYAYDRGLKGCTTFRFNPRVFQGVLVRQKDLENTLYRFELDDGTVVEARGNEEVEYEGEVHTAANLFDALKEGYYGKL